MARPSKCVYGSSTSRSAASRVSTSSRSPCSPSACASGGAAIVLESSRRGGGGGRARKAGTGSGITESSFGDDRAWHIAGASSDVASIGSVGGAHGPSVPAADGGSTFWRLLVSSTLSSCTKSTRIMSSCACTLMNTRAPGSSNAVCVSFTVLQLPSGFSTRTGFLLRHSKRTSPVAST